MRDGKKPGVALWSILLVIAMLVAYPLSFGPAVWCTASGHLSRILVRNAYWPLLWTIVHGPGPAAKPLTWWASLEVPTGSWADFHVDDSPDGFVCFFGE